MAREIIDLRLLVNAVVFEQRSYRITGTRSGRIIRAAVEQDTSFKNIIYAELSTDLFNVQVVLPELK